MKRHSPLKRKSELIRGAPLRNRGTKARRDVVEMKEAERDMGLKECRGHALIGTCCFGRLERHHVLPRSRGGNNSPENLIWLCLLHHDWVEDNRTEAKEMGLLR